jgi:CheY-like chemotaxis protein
MEAALACDAATPATPPAPDGFDLDLARRSPLRILLAEDNVVNQRVASVILGKFGYDADVVGNGREALEAMARASYDLVLMDVQMPELDGLEATRRIRATPARAHRPSIIAMTANARQEDVQECLAAGMDGVLTKPVSVADLRVLLQKLATARASETPA